MNETVSRLLDAWRDEYARKLAEWVKIPSVEAEAEDGAPFGREVRRALDTAMSTMLQQDPGSAIKDDELTMDEKV